MTLPLDGVRVIDMAEGKCESTGRFLADLGADVVRVEPPGGAPSRQHPPIHLGTSLYFETRNANKRGVTLNLDDPTDRTQLVTLCTTADILIETEKPGRLSAIGLAPAVLMKHNPQLVVVSITDFGQTGPYRNWRATNDVQIAMAGVLSRSGAPGATPLLPPGQIAYECAAMQAAWAALLAYHNRLDTDLGDHVDCSIYEITAQTLDPGFGTHGSAVVAGATQSTHGRPDARHLYPVFACLDGYVRVCLLSKRQWRAMWDWMGQPPEFSAPEYDAWTVRQRSPGLVSTMAVFLGQQSRADIVAEGQRRGVPVAGVLSPAEVLTSDHYHESGILIDSKMADGTRVRLVSGVVQIDGERRRPQCAPTPGQHNDEIVSQNPVLKPPRTPAAPAAGGLRRPLEDLRVVDLGVIVAGAELGRLLADQGADVIKIEDAQYPDGLRISPSGEPMSRTFAWGHRNQMSFGLNLRTPEGRDIFFKLTAKADVILSNFKPGTMSSLGIGYDDIAAVNPRIVFAESSAFGGGGRWKTNMGYGPLVRASTGLTWLWRHTGEDSDFCDASTVYPDHVVARASAAAVLAGLIARRRSGRGCLVSLSQADVVLTHMADLLMAEYLRSGCVRPPGRPDGGEHSGVYECAGEDDWCTITVGDDEDWQRLCAAIGQEGLITDGRFASSRQRRAHDGEIDDLISQWTSTRPSREVVDILQAAAVPAGLMQRVSAYPDDPHLRARQFLRPMHHPLFNEPILAESGPAKFTRIAEPPLNPAPGFGAHTRQIARSLLSMDTTQIEMLISRGILQEETTHEHKTVAAQASRCPDVGQQPAPGQTVQ
jgi:crotonobetainyl-CoA:carnitine CoA-transferase CaiB-like acyl-CoA transferase